MSAFDPFRGGGSPKADNVCFVYRFLIRELPLVQMGVVQVHLGLVSPNGDSPNGGSQIGGSPIRLGLVQMGVDQ